MVDELLNEVATATRNLCDGLESGDHAQIARCYSPAADYSDPVLGDLGVGSARRVWPLILANLERPRWRFEIEDVGLLKSRLRTQVDFAFVPTGRPVSLDISTVLHVRDGRITHHSDLFERRQWAAAFSRPNRLLPPMSPLRQRFDRMARLGRVNTEDYHMSKLVAAIRQCTTAATVATLGMASAPALAQQFLRPADAVRLIMDGRPWSAQASDGKTLKITLNRDGTGSAQGPMPFALSVSWEVKGEDVCLHIGPAGTKCVRFRQVAGGFEGFAGGRLDLTLQR